MKKIMNLTLSQKRKIVASTALPTVAVILLMSFQNCSPGLVQSQKMDSTGQPSSASMNLDEDTKPVTVVYSENILVSMQQQTGLQTVANTTLNANTRFKAMISETGKADTVNAPMWVAVTNLAGEVCFDLLKDEKAKPADQRRFFKQVDFTKAPSAITSDGKADLIRRMARNFWGRNETTVEKMILLSSLDEAIADPRRTNQNDATETEDISIFACTSMLASLDSVKF